MRIITHERASAHPLTPEQAAGFVADWLEPEVSWIPREGPGHARILADLITRYQLRGNIVSDAHLAALASNYGFLGIVRQDRSVDVLVVVDAMPMSTYPRIGLEFCPAYCAARNVTTCHYGQRHAEREAL